MALKDYQVDFLNKLAPYAVADWNSNHVVLPSVTLSQGLRESGWGTSELAVKANNLFGVKAGNNWTGKVYVKDTQEYYDGVNPTIIKDAFRVYDNWGQGVADHAQFLTKPNYAAAKGQTDFTLACNYIKKGGYATGPYYSANLVSDIIGYKLYNYDPVPADFDEILRVQIGAYSNKDNAQAAAMRLQAAGFQYCILYGEDTKLYYVQTGAYRDKVTASTVFCNLILAGFQPIIKVKK